MRDSRKRYENSPLLSELNEIIKGNTQIKRGNGKITYRFRVEKIKRT